MKIKPLPNKKQMEKGVNITIINNQGKILILKRSFSEHSFPGLWDLPGGKVKNAETLQRAAKREAKEESGLSVKIEQNYFYIYHCKDRKLNIHGFKAKLINGDITLSEEHTELRWVSRDEWRGLKYTPSVRATIREFFKIKKAVDVVILNSKNQILILKRSPVESRYPSLWDFPGGGVREGEDLKEAAEREIKEEAGIKVKINDKYFYIFSCKSDPKIEIFAFKGYLVGGEIVLSQEHTEFKWISKAEYKNFEYTPGVASIINEFFKNKN